MSLWELDSLELLKIWLNMLLLQGLNSAGGGQYLLLNLKRSPFT